jgi:hypothetical protein
MKQNLLLLIQIQTFPVSFWSLEFRKFWSCNFKGMSKHKKVNIAVTYPQLLAYGGAMDTVIRLGTLCLSLGAYVILPYLSKNWSPCRHTGDMYQLCNFSNLIIF